MKVGYTEFSFGYAFTENLIRWSAATPATAPHFPNLFQEATLGYDVRIELPACPLLLQYKLPELLVRETAKEHSHPTVRVSVPYFRMPLMRRDFSAQHRLLMEWDEKRPDTVYYATPELGDINGFNAAYLNARVHFASALFSPGEIGPLPDDKQHHVVYEAGGRWGWVCSDPKDNRVRLQRYEQMGDRWKELFQRPEYESLFVAAQIALKDVQSLIPLELREAEDTIRSYIKTRQASVPDRPKLADTIIWVVEELLVARELARIGLGSDLIIAQPRS